MELKITDSFAVFLDSAINDNDICEIVDLYLPIIGSDAFTLYLQLRNYGIAKRNKISVNSLLEITGLNKAIFNDARCKLEGISLLRTFIDEQTNNFKFLLLAPNSPRDFFQDDVLKRVLYKTVGSKRYNYLVTKYSSDFNSSFYKEITTSFNDSYVIDFDKIDIEYDEKKNEFIMGKERKKLKFVFDERKFFTYIHERGMIEQNEISVEELDNIIGLANVYGYNEESIGNFVIKSFTNMAPIGQKLDLKSLAKSCMDAQIFGVIAKKETINKEKYEISSNTKLAKKIKLMESTTPFEFLKLMQNNVSPVASDCKILNNLSIKLGLQNGPINAIIEYVLTHYDNRLSSALCEKIAASIVRNGFVTALDTSNFLLKNVDYKSKKTNDQNTTMETNSIEATQESNENDSDYVSDEEMKRMLKELEK